MGEPLDTFDLAPGLAADAFLVAGRRYADARRASDAKPSDVALFAAVREAELDLRNAALAAFPAGA